MKSIIKKTIGAIITLTLFYGLTAPLAIAQVDLPDPLETIKEKYPVIATIPSEDGWEVEVVADTLDGYQAESIDPNLEHAYMYFMEYVLNNNNEN